MPKRKLKKAINVFKFWFKVLCDTPLMDDPEHRNEYKKAIRVVKKQTKSKPV